ncbi:MAG: signal peptidase I [Thermoplasmatota archaeon]
MDHPVRDTILLSGGAALVVLLLAAPLLAGTSAYPIAIVQGTSMYPNLHNGDIVFFEGSTQTPRVGQVIVFVQGQTGYGPVDSLLKPVLIHRVVAVGHEPDGSPDFTTKGDNNQANDPFITASQNVLGVEAVDIPYAGLPILFLESPYGMISVVAVLCLVYFSGMDTRESDAEDRERFLAVFGRYALQGDLSLAYHDRIRLLVEVQGRNPPANLNDPNLAAIGEWLKGGGLGRAWAVTPTRCSECAFEGATIGDSKASFFFCPRCAERTARRIRQLQEVGRAALASEGRTQLTPAPAGAVPDEADLRAPAGGATQSPK